MIVTSQFLEMIVFRWSCVSGGKGSEVSLSCLLLHEDYKTSKIPWWSVNIGHCRQVNMIFRLHLWQLLLHELCLQFLKFSKDKLIQSWQTVSAVICFFFRKSTKYEFQWLSTGFMIYYDSVCIALDLTIFCSCSEVILNNDMKLFLFFFSFTAGRRSANSMITG